ncbi:MAG: DNA-binding protein [Sulfuricellaceae bacterium]
MTDGWYSAQALAGLPGMPGTERGVRKTAEKNLWQVREKTRGKGYEYPITSLPAETRAYLTQQLVLAATMEADQITPPVARPSLPAKRPAVPASHADAAQLLVRDARLGILNAIARAVEAHGISAAKSIDAWLTGIEDARMAPMQQLWCAIANDKSGFNWRVDWSSGQAVAAAAPDQDLHAFAAKLSRRTLFRWIRLRADGGDDALIPGVRTKDMQPPAWLPYFLAEMQRPQKPSKRDAWEGMAKTLSALGWKEHCGKKPCSGKEYPGYSQALRWYTEKYSKLDAQKGRNTGSAMNPHKFCHTRSSEGMWPLLEVHSDGWGTHFLAPHPISGKYVTCEVWHSHDVATRKAYVSERSIGLSESMVVILGSLYAVSAEDGEPVVWQTDNTGSVKNDRVEFDPVASVAARRGTTIVHNLPGNSQANGIAESFNRYMDRRAKELATYQGKDMDSLARKRVHKITQKLVKAQGAGDAIAAENLRAEAERAGCGLMFKTYAEAVEWIKRVVAEFNDMPHSSLPKTACPVTGKRRHMTPNERMAQFIANGWKRKPLNGEELEDAFRVHERKFVRRGRISLMGQDYHHPEMDHINGEEVMVAYDLNDGERVWIKTLDGAPLFEAHIYKERSYRTRSFYEIALEKRADMQIKRHETQINDIEAQRPSALLESLEMEAGIVLPAMPVAEYALAGAENVIPLERKTDKPNFTTSGDYTLLKWLSAHPEDWTPEYRRYIAMKVKRGGSTVIEGALEEFELWNEINDEEIRVAS